MLAYTPTEHLDLILLNYVTSVHDDKHGGATEVESSFANTARTHVRHDYAPPSRRTHVHHDYALPSHRTHVLHDYVPPSRLVPSVHHARSTYYY